MSTNIAHDTTEDELVEYLSSRPSISREFTEDSILSSSWIEDEEDDFMRRSEILQRAVNALEKMGETPDEQQSEDKIQEEAPLKIDELIGHQKELIEQLKIIMSKVDDIAVNYINVKEENEKIRQDLERKTLLIHKVKLEIKFLAYSLLLSGAVLTGIDVYNNPDSYPIAVKIFTHMLTVPVNTTIVIRSLTGYFNSLFYG